MELKSINILKAFIERRQMQKAQSKSEENIVFYLLNQNSYKKCLMLQKKLDVNFVAFL